MTKVYLSSTRLDLEAERQAVTDWLIAADFQPVHSYVANSETVRESCLEDIASCDFLVLIVGHRYGHQPKDGNLENLSITRLEFRKARQIDLPCLAFLRTSVPDIGLSDVNDPARFALVQAFRSEVADTARPAEFKDLTEFVAAFSAAILRHVTKLLKQRDASAPLHEQRIGELEAELQATRESALSRVLADAEQPQADDLGQRARAALLKGETTLAEELLREQEDRAANAAGENRREAATLARQIASLAVGRDNRAALAALERAVGYLPEDFGTQIELGDAQRIAGQSSAALLSYRAARAIAETLAVRNPADTQWQRGISVSHNRIGNMLLAQGDGPGALAAFRKGLAIAETLAARDPANTMGQRDISVGYNKIGDVLLAQGDGPGALATFRKSLAVAETLAAREPANTLWQRDLSVSHDRIGGVLLAQGDRQGARATFIKGLTIAAVLAARDPANTQWQRDLSVSHDRIGDVLLAQGGWAGALAAFRKGLAIRETLTGGDPANTEWLRNLSVSHEKIGDTLLAQGDGPDALAAFRKNLAVRETLAASDPANTEWQRDLMVSHNQIAVVLLALGDLPGALAACRKGLSIAEALAACDPTYIQWQRDLSRSLTMTGDVLLAQGDESGALATSRKGQTIAETLAAADPANTELQRDLVVSNVKLADASGDESYAGRALKIAEDMQQRGILAPRDAWMIDELNKRANK